MPRTPVLFFLTAIAIGTALFAKTGYANPATGAIPANGPDERIQLAQDGPGSGTGTGRVPQYGPGSGTGTGRVPQYGPGSGTGTGRVPQYGPGSGTGTGRVRCRTVVVPGSGRGPQRVCH
jgi:hypothetical protein